MKRFLVLSFLAACGGSSMTPPGGGDDDPTPDAPPPSNLDPADCTPIAQNFVAGAQMCGSQVPGNALAQLETMCRRGLDVAELCGGNVAAGFDCFVTQDPTDWECALGEPFPACNGDLAASLGMYCVMALGNPACASGIQCEFNSDCSDGLSCNGATGQCFSQTAFCIGLPCEFNSDCPQGETCNGAEGACVGE